eukprot:493583_1
MAVNLVFPCSRSDLVVQQIDKYIDLDSMLFTIRECGNMLSTENETLEEHLIRCIHCSLHYLINKRNKYKGSNYYKYLARSQLGIFHDFVRKKIINNQEYFNFKFQSSASKLLRMLHTSYEELGVCLLYDVICTLKIKHIPFLFASERNSILLCSLYHEFVNSAREFAKKLAANKSIADRPKVDSFARCMFLITYKIQQHMNSRDQHNILCDSLFSKQLLAALRGFGFIMKMPLQRRSMLETNTNKCGNILCKKIYLENKYGIITDATFMDLVKQWENRKVINKWYMCKGCKCIKYCSKYCQKISWNFQNHRYYCTAIRSNPLF